MLICVAVILLLRIPGLRDFVTVDEATWLMRSGNFYYALGQREFSETSQAYHPAVTTMWVGAVGTWIVFPEYRGQGQGYFIKEVKYTEFLDRFDVEVLDILFVSRLITVLIHAALLFLISIYLFRLAGLLPAILAGLFLGFDPFLSGHSRIMAHEGMMSLLVIVSLLAALAYLGHGRRRLHLVVSAAAASLAMLTKSTATLLIPVMAVMFLVDMYFLRTRGSVTWQAQVRGFATWFLVLSAVYFLAWPAMWTAPDRALSEVYANAFSYAFTGHQLDLVGESIYRPFELGEEGVVRYITSILWHTTPVIWVGLLLGIFNLMARFREEISRSEGDIFLILLIFAAGFTAVMSFAGGRQAAHYIMSAYAALDIAAAFGFVMAFRRLPNLTRLPLVSIRGTYVLGYALVLFHCFSSYPFFPYYFNYTNPIMARTAGLENVSGGYGEVLELAAAYLNTKPGAEDLTVLSWYGIGPFSFFFSGETELLAPSSAWEFSQINRLKRSDYLVIYYHQQNRRSMPASLMRLLRNEPPEYVIWENGIEYVRIYDVAKLPEEVRIPDPSVHITP